MELTKTTKHSISFSVKYFEPTEGGMDTDCFGNKSVDTIQEAVELLDIALATSPSCDWIIVLDVEKLIK